MKTALSRIYERNKIPKYFFFKDFKGGDIVLVSYRYKRLETFAPVLKYFLGICLAFKRSGYTSFLTLRNHYGHEGVEFSFNIFSPCILALKKIKVMKGKYVRSRIFYLRERIA
jgi:ribosomal protein L19